MEQFTKGTLDRRIEAFLDTKLAKYPELRSPIEAKPHRDIYTIWHDIEKVFAGNRTHRISNQE